MVETNIKISLELVDKAAQKALGDFIDKTGSADKNLDKLKKSGKSTFDEITVGIGKSIGIFDIFAGNLAANVVIKSFDLMTEAASKLFEVFIVDGVEGAQKAQEALNSLNFALAQSGIYSKETSKSFVDFAEELQSTTAYEDDLIIQNAALIQSLAQLDEQGLKRATQASVDLSAALGISLEQASQTLAKAANGNVTALQKMGITIQKGRDDAETFANALKAVEDRFSGAAASKLNTFTGALAQTKNEFGNLTEEIGNLIVKNPAVISVINEAAKIFKELTDATKGQSSAFIDLIGNGISNFLTVSAFVIAAVDQTIRVFQTIYGVLQAVSTVFLPITFALRALAVGFQQASKETQEFTKEIGKNLTALGSSGDGALSELSTDLLRLGNAADKGMESLKNGADGTVEPINRAGGAVKGLSQETEKAQGRLKDFANDLVKQSEDVDAATKTQLDQAKYKAEQEQQILDAQLQAQSISYYDYQTQRDQIDAEFDAARQELALQQLSDDNARLTAALNQNLISESEYYKAKTQLNTNFENDKAKRDSEISKREANQQKERLNQEKAYNQSKLQATSDVFGAIASVAALGGRKNFEIVKAFNLAEAITAGILAVQKAAASAPPPFNVPAIVSATALSAANVIRIAATQAPSFEDGGIVGGNSFTGDRVAANVNSGEMIINRQQQRTLFSMANGGFSNSGNVEGLLIQLIGAVERASVTVNIGGKTIVDTLRSELSAGRTFA